MVVMRQVKETLCILLTKKNPREKILVRLFMELVEKQDATKILYFLQDKTYPSGKLKDVGSISFLLTER